MLKKFVFKKISTIDIPKSSKLDRYVNKVRKLYHAWYKCNNKCDSKIINLNKMAIPKKSYLLSFFSRHYQRIMKKCNARRYLSLFSCDCVSYMTNYLNFKLRACLHGGGGPQLGEVTCGGSPHLSCKRDQIKMRDYVDRRVTHQSGLLHLPGVPHRHVNRP